MKLDANNNGGIIYCIARSNLEGNRLYSFFSMLTITLSLTFILTILLFLQETRTVEKRMLKQMQHVMYMISLYVRRDMQEEFVICGYTDGGRQLSVYPIYVSKEYADNGLAVKDMPYTALVRIADAPDMEASVFETMVYQLAADYGVKRSDVHINSRFEKSLQADNPVLQAILLISLFILAASGFGGFFSAGSGRQSEL